jgi:hypothetical protein
MKVSNQHALAGLLLIWALIFGVYVRILPVLQAGFPLNDGGLFYTMTADLHANGYFLPATTSYNGLDIPFVYPPLMFYVTGLIHSMSGLPLIEVVRWLPVLFSLLTLPAFYLLARALLDDPLSAALATAIFATLPRAYEWIIMGGGITRAPATLFLILMGWGAYRLFTQGGWKNGLVTAVSAALIVLTHPERTLHAVVTAAVLWFFFGRTFTGLRRGLFVAGGVLLLTAPWWLLVLSRDGWAPFQSAMRAGGQQWLFWAPLLTLNFTDEPIPLAAILAAFGFIGCLLQKKSFLPVWLVAAFLADPRSAPHVVPLQISLLAALGLVEVIFPALARLVERDAPPAGVGTFLSSGKGRWVLGYILLVLLVGAIINIQSLGTYVLSQDNRSALSWVVRQTPPESRFLSLTWQEDAMLSPLLEWFPALSGRTNISTMQGREWLPDTQNYTVRLETFPDLQACLYNDETCLERWAARQDESFDHIYLWLGSSPRLSALALSLRQSARYQLVYDTPAVLIFARR